MEIHQVRYFLAVTETRSFTRAAERCGISQPALTTAIKKLEEELGGALLLRERSGIKLTALGLHVLPRLQRLHDEHQDEQGDVDGRIGYELCCRHGIPPGKTVPAPRPLLRLRVSGFAGLSCKPRLREREFDVLNGIIHGVDGRRASNASG